MILCEISMIFMSNFQDFLYKIFILFCQISMIFMSNFHPFYIKLFVTQIFEGDSEPLYSKSLHELSVLVRVFYPLATTEEKRNVGQGPSGTHPVTQGV